MGYSKSVSVEGEVFESGFFQIVKVEEDGFAFSTKLEPLGTQSYLPGHSFIRRISITSLKERCLKLGLTGKVPIDSKSLALAQVLVENIPESVTIEILPISVFEKPRVSRELVHCVHEINS
eukprot:GHVH01001006.1.p2 GENE.GHVH01001006.1~~GHVH01001006.1.p2  ORF type:complete len:121 (+),score=10.39 GHVH01001006.1:439-801(+)